VAKPLPQVAAQAPPEHTWPGPQATPHAPQLALSVAVRVQLPLQTTEVPAHGGEDAPQPASEKSSATTGNQRATRAMDCPP